MTITTDVQLKKRKISLSQEVIPLAPISQLLVKRLSPKAKIPTRGSPLSAGYDLSRSVSHLYLLLLATDADFFLYL